MIPKLPRDAGERGDRECLAFGVERLNQHFDRGGDFRWHGNKMPCAFASIVPEFGCEGKGEVGHSASDTRFNRCVVAL